MRTSSLCPVESWPSSTLDVGGADTGVNEHLAEAVFDAAMQQDAMRDFAVSLRNAPYPFKPIRIRTLGGFALSIGGVPIKFGRKVQKKPLEILKALVACGGTQVCCTKLAEALWPDADGDLAARALATALYRLRKLLGPHCVLRHDGMLSIDQRLCDVDVWRLDRLLAEIVGYCRDRDFSNAAARTEQLLADEHSTFLPHDTDLPWVLSARERYRSKLLRAIALAGDCMSRADRYDLAVACYERGIDIDPLSESMYCALMQLQLTDQRYSEVVTTYDRCRRALRTELAMAPSPRVDAMYRQVRTMSATVGERVRSAPLLRLSRFSICVQSVIE